MIPTTMKAALVHAFGQPLRIENVPVPSINSQQILVKVLACGVCHTDLHAANGDWPVKPQLPFIPGHEAIGRVVAAGNEVRDISIDDIVGVPWLHSACGCCEFCITGWETLCEKQINGGYSVNGGFAEYVSADPAYVARFPKGVNILEMAPVICAGVTVYKGLKETEVRPCEWVAISGIGGLGHMAIQYAKAMGMHVAAIDVAEEKLELARRLGADIMINPLAEDLGKLLKQKTGGMHGVLVTAVSPKAFEQGISMLRRKGTIALVGLPKGGFELPIFDTVLNRYTVRGSIVGTRKDMQEAILFAVEGKVRANIHVSSLGKINEVFEQMKSGSIEGRVVLNISEA